MHQNQLRLQMTLCCVVERRRHDRVPGDVLEDAGRQIHEVGRQKIPFMDFRCEPEQRPTVRMDTVRRDGAVTHCQCLGPVVVE